MKQHLMNTLLICCFISFLSCIKPSELYSFDKIEYPEDLKKLHENVLNYHLNLEIDHQELKKDLENLLENGSFSSIDYTNKIRGNWPVKFHLQKVQNFAIVYKNKNSAFYQNKNLSIKIHQSLNYWLDNDFLSTNWWDQHIGVPELLLPTLFLMEDELSKNQKEKALVLLYRAKIKMSGQNKVWLSTNVMLRSLFLRKVDSVAIASKSIQNELQISKGVGVKADWSYHEHGAQLQFGNYGLSFLEDMLKCYSFVNDTPFQFKEDKIEVLRNYILEGQQWIIWNKNYDINASGRQLFPNEQSNKYERLKKCIDKMKSLDTDFSLAYEHAKDSKILSGNKHFWESDFNVHRRKDFYFSVKMSSKRVIGTESVNQENIQGYYLGDGVSLLYSNGDEYKDIFPFWDWKQLPGTTIIQDEKPLPIIKFSDFKTDSEFVGGVSNNENGIAVLDYNRDGLKAKKSWFLFDEKIVCLGADIEANTDFKVATTVNQVFLKGDIMVSENNKIIEKFNSSELKKLDWILHDDTGYLFLNEDNVKVQTRFLEGSWYNVAKRFRPVILTESTFKIWFDHGKNPKDKRYEYILVPNANKQKMEELKIKKPFQIVNTKTQQSVISSDEKIGGIVFYEAGTSNIYGGISVDKPCIVLLQKKEFGIEVSISDPSQKLEAVTVLFKKYVIENKKDSLNEKNSLKVDLPSGNESGKTVKFYLKK
ncbi:polysaccharide lyase 8 family protein [Polaribacter glomeratus]|uniref:Chondroitin AC lyase n=1 Tax=Polaribacter glomeratus TaxID=102 RepID=A0A2S7WG57_9FLAO|nr:polysaccharide lyase 8 family protein [Polaribacter glomeratus]PQJ76593.1 hypothetical protein BTO16_11905 [Polaribacter glomeratus]TXD67569.1 polysaccharide lyase 8 family protein [Polaribacter glomeratus]